MAGLSVAGLSVAGLGVAGLGVAGLGVASAAAPRGAGATGLAAPVDDVRVVAGPRLLDPVAEGPSLAAHRSRHGPLGQVTLQDLLTLARELDLRGRGGAGFPFATKLAAAARGRRPLVVVNAAEGEPASAKDFALAVTAPHQVLDGAALAAKCLGTKEIHVVTSQDRPSAGWSFTDAIGERVAGRERLRWHTHVAQPGFVSGQARAVIELLSGRPGLPVTAWQPEAVHGYHGRPTLLSNAETFAQVAALVRLGSGGYAELGLTDEPGTVLLTITDDSGTRVVEVATGTPWRDLLTEAQLGRPVLLGGFHGTWAAAGQLERAVVGRSRLRDLGLALGAGVVLVPAADECPVSLTAQIVAYLAASTAGRCGPCFNGLPAISLTLDRLASGHGGAPEVDRLHDLGLVVERRGACAHPDGTVRLVRSLLTACADEVAAHSSGSCLSGTGRG